MSVSELKKRCPTGKCVPKQTRSGLWFCAKCEYSVKSPEMKSCHACGVEKQKSEMYHVQQGFGVIWKCKDRTKCAKRAAKVVK